MSNYTHDQDQTVAYPPPVTAYPAEPRGGYMAAPPPAGYPTRDGQQEQAAATATQSRGDDCCGECWDACYLVLCCCCVDFWGSYDESDIV